MATFVFGMNQSLDGYVDHTEFAPDPTLFRHFVEQAQEQTGSVYGRVMYELMRVWDDDLDWSEDEQKFAAAWRAQPKWVVSHTLDEVGPNATLVGPDLEAEMRALKAEQDGEIEIAGTGLARSLGELGLIDAFRVYLHPAVLGSGRPFFDGWRPLLRLMDSERIGENVVRLTYAPA